MATYQIVVRDSDDVVLGSIRGAAIVGETSETVMGPYGDKPFNDDSSLKAGYSAIEQVVDAGEPRQVVDAGEPRHAHNHTHRRSGSSLRAATTQEREEQEAAGNPQLAKRREMVRNPNSAAKFSDIVALLGLVEE